MPFEKGDLVRLTSGGPIMTVEQTGEHYTFDGTSVWCVWFEKVGAKQVASRETFAEVVLEEAERPGVASLRVMRS